MKTAYYQRVIVLILGLVAITVFQTWSYQAFGQDNSTVSSFQLRPGVIVTSDRSQAYVMTAEGGIDALDLSQGTVVWTTKEASKPLGLKGNLLICQAEPSGARNKLDVVALNVQEGGKRVVAGTMALPSEVTVSIDDTLNTSFVANAQPLEGDAVVSWDHSKHPIQGIPPVTEVSPEDPDRRALGFVEEAPSTLPSTSSGALRMDLTSGAMSSIPAEEAPVPRAMRGPNVFAAEERIAGVSGNQFISADSSHVLSSERIANDAVWEKYRWTIFNRSTGERMGEIRSHVSVSPFFVANSQVIYETTPFLRQTQNGLVEEPAKIRAVDLNTGQELWSKQIRDTVFRGPYPP